MVMLMNDGKKIAVIRVRGSTSMVPQLNETLRLLGLTRVNHCVVLGRTAQTAGMVELAKNYVAWGEVDAPTLAAVMEKRGRLAGDKKLSDALVKASGFSSFSDFAEKVVAGKAQLNSVKGIKKVFRLHPPKKGHKGGIKKAYPYGALGNRGAEINELLKRMI